MSPCKRCCLITFGDVLTQNHAYALDERHNLGKCCAVVCAQLNRCLVQGLQYFHSCSHYFRSFALKLSRIELSRSEFGQSLHHYILAVQAGGDVFEHFVLCHVHVSGWPYGMHTHADARFFCINLQLIATLHTAEKKFPLSFWCHLCRAVGCGLGRGVPPSWIWQPLKQSSCHCQ